MQKFGRLDGAANMAGILGKGTTVKKTHEIEQDSWDQLIAINLTDAGFQIGRLEL